MKTGILFKKDRAIIGASFDGNRMTDVSVTGEDREFRPGDIYVATIRQIVPNIGGMFLQMGGDRNCFLKLSKADHPIVRQTHADGALHCGDELVVQVEREEGKNKPASVVTEFALTGVYLVLFHGGEGVRVSSKIMDEAWKKEMRGKVSEWIDGDYALMLRTNSYEADPAEIEREFKMLHKTYQTICSEGMTRTNGTLLWSGLPAYLCELRDHKGELPDRIIVPEGEIADEVSSFCERFRPELLPKLSVRKNDEYPVEAEFDMNKRLRELTARKVWLKSGAYLVIDPTEAMTVIDVNSGKASAARSAGDLLSVNLEAAREIASQIRLRNLSGIILVDAIDMTDVKAQETLLATLRELVCDDPVETKVVDITRLNLVEITRRKQRRPLAEELRKHTDNFA
ncbi:MAG: ribonuclease E/G [Lachnospiraceae bacterium]|nr:ribonuclease E/G [Lachnospiraceae bacterium]